MQLLSRFQPTRSGAVYWGIGSSIVAVLLISMPERFAAAALFAIQSLIDVAPLIVPGVLLSAWVTASGAGGLAAQALRRRPAFAILAASAAGAVTPVCGITVLPLMAGFLASGVPLAPIMAFWLSSPITDPAMLAVTAATLGTGFALGKSLAALGLGLLGGLGTVLAPRSWTDSPLRNSRATAECITQSLCEPTQFRAAVWVDPARRKRFGEELGAMTRLLLICLVPAFMAEYALNELLAPRALAAYAGQGSWWAVPLAVLVGAPAYIDGYAALPLTRSLVDHGLSQGAAMAFLVSGGVISIWGAMAILPVLRLRAFLLYALFGISGSMCAGWLYQLAVSGRPF